MTVKDSLRAGFWFQQLEISCLSDSEQDMLLAISVSLSPEPTRQIIDSTDSRLNGYLYADISNSIVPNAYTSDSCVYSFFSSN